MAKGLALLIPLSCRSQLAAQSADEGGANHGRSACISLNLLAISLKVLGHGAAADQFASGAGPFGQLESACS